MSCEEALFRGLRERGMRVTPQREIVLSVLHEIEDHATVDEIHRRVLGRSSAINISTVYRTMEMLEKMDMLAIVEGADGLRRYALRHIHAPHGHLLCSQCGALLDADPATVASLASALRASNGFELAESHLTLNGLCAACACSEHPHAVKTSDSA